MSKSGISLAGVFPPIATPFDAEGNVHYEALAGNLERWNQFDLAGYVVLGSNGEVVLLAEEEKLALLAACRRAIPPGKLLIAGTGCESTRQTIALTRQAAEIGADAALVVTPHYYTNKMTPDVLVRHFHIVADASPIPVIMYNVPANTGLDMSAATIARAAEHPNIVGIKDSGGNITKIGDTIRLTQPDFQVLAGSTGFFLAALCLGAVGGVLGMANIAPQQAIDIHRLFEAGWLNEAAELQRRMIPVNAAVTAVMGVPGLKAALDMLGWYGGPVRSPLLDIDEGQRETLRAILVEGGVLPPE